MLPKKEAFEKAVTSQRLAKSNDRVCSPCYFSSLIIYSNGGSNLHLTAQQKAPVTLATVLFNVAMINLLGSYFPGLRGAGLGATHRDVEFPTSLSS